MYHCLNTLLSLLEKWKIEKIELERQGQSFSPASLFSAIYDLKNLGTPCPSSDFQKIMDISTKLTNVNNLIEFCETILRKMKSTEEPLNPNEKTFLDYIYMVSQILGMTLELEKIQTSTDLNFSNYKNALEFIKDRISKRFDAFVNFMTYSSYLQRVVHVVDKCGFCKSKTSGSPTTRGRTITPNERIEIQEREDAKNEEIECLSNEHQDIIRQKKHFLEIYCQLLASVSKPIRTFGLKYFPELSFFLSDFDSDHFKTFLSNFQTIDENFQLFKTEIDAFSQHMESLRQKCLEEYNKPDEYLDKWNSCIRQGIAFYGKRD